MLVVIHIQIAVVPVSRDSFVGVGVDAVAVAMSVNSYPIFDSNDDIIHEDHTPYTQTIKSNQIKSNRIESNQLNSNRIANRIE